MTDDLLTKEKEFRRINKELDKKTSELFKEVELVVNNSNNHLATKNLFSTAFSRFHNLPNNFDTFNDQSSFDNDIFHNLYKNNNENTKSKDNSVTLAADHKEKIKFARNEENQSLDNDFFSSENNNLKSNDAIIKFLKAKIKVLMNDLDIMKDELRKKDNYVKDLQIENKKINDFKDKLNNQIINFKNTISKLENNISNQQTELQACLNENNSLKKDIESTRKELKNITQQMNCLDLRLNRSLEDNEKLKNGLKINEHEEKSLRDKIRKLEHHERLMIKNYERQFSEILQAFKKQSLLIDNLKKQKAYLEASKQINLTRDDFLKVLKTEI